MTLELQILDALTKRLCQIDVITNAFGHVKVVTRNPLIDQFIESLIQFIVAKVLRGMFQRVRRSFVDFIDRI